MEHPAETSRVQSSLIAPVAPKQRFQIIDIIRGFALFGVLYINLLWTSQYAASDSAPKGFFTTGPLDTAAFFFSEFFINHKFYALFSILFGLGFSIQLTRASERDHRIIAVYARRLTILFAVGIIHAILIWSGDILHIYALLGFPLILFHKCKNRTLLRWAGVVFALTVAVTVLQWTVLDQDAGPESQLADAPIESLGDPGIEQSPFQQLTSNNYADVVKFNWHKLVTDYTAAGIGPGSNVYWYLTIFWKFLLGMYIGRTMILQKASDHRLFFKKALPWAIGSGLLGHAAMFVGFGPLEHLVFQNPISLAIFWLVVEAGMFGLAMTYLCLLVLWYLTPSGQRVLSWLAPLGRMALTNYLMHSVLFVVIFYGVGFGLLGSISHFWCLPLSLAILGMQIVYSAWWLKRFRFGPMEWLWRCLTYAKIQQMRIAPEFDL